MIILLDLNGTIATDGKILDGVKERLKTLKEKGAKIYILSADTFGTLGEIAKELGVEGRKIDKTLYESEKKAKLMALLEFKKENPSTFVVAIGNGNNDGLMLKAADLGICVIGDEGAYTETLLNSDIVVKDINDALDLLIKEKRLKATIRE
jgi:P-type E1-E2 ATPase